MEFEDYLKTEQVKELYSRIKFVLVTTFGISTLTMSSISDGFPMSHIISWLALTTLIIIIRAWCYRYYDPNNVTVKNHDKWLRQHVPPGCTMHSFRHSMRDRLRETQCPSDITDQIGCWATTSVGQGYGSGYSLNVLQEWMEKTV